MMHLPVDSINAKPTNVPKELRPPLGRAFGRRMSDILAYFDHDHSSNGLTEVSGCARCFVQNIEHNREIPLIVARPVRLPVPGSLVSPGPGDLVG